jgi:hypothetical protein
LIKGIQGNTSGWKKRAVSSGICRFVYLIGNPKKPYPARPSFFEKSKFGWKSGAEMRPRRPNGMRIYTSLRGAQPLFLRY